MTVTPRCDPGATWPRGASKGRRPRSRDRSGPHPSRLGRRRAPAPLAP